MKSLAVLQRLAKQAVDQERQVLQAIGDEIRSIEAEIQAACEWREREAAGTPDFRTSGSTLFAFLEASKRRSLELEQRRQALQQAYEIQLERVKLQRVEEKRYERLAERRATQAAQEEALKEQKTIDELVMIGRRKG